MDKTDEAPSKHVLVTAKAPMNVLLKDEDDSLRDAFERELDEEMTAERALAFFEDADFAVEALDDA